MIHWYIIQSTCVDSLPQSITHLTFGKKSTGWFSTPICHSAHLSIIYKRWRNDKEDEDEDEDEDEGVEEDEDTEKDKIKMKRKIKRKLKIKEVEDNDMLDKEIG